LQIFSLIPQLPFIFARCFLCGRAFHLEVDHCLFLLLFLVLLES
jgi:hypothetical protein